MGADKDRQTSGRLKRVGEQLYWVSEAKASKVEESARP